MKDRLTELIDLFAKPLTVAFVTALVVCSTERTAWALVGAIGLVFIYMACIFVLNCLPKLCPRTACHAFFVFLAGFAGGLYYFAVSFFNPTLGVETLFIALLDAVSVSSSGLDKRLAQDRGAARKLLLEPIAVAVIMLLIAVFREVLSNFTLSLPGGPGGFREFPLYGAGTAPADAGLNLLFTAGGALLLLGFIITLLRFLREKAVHRARKDTLEGNQEVQQ
jgi:hypothetical protein